MLKLTTFKCCIFYWDIKITIIKLLLLYMTGSRKQHSRKLHRRKVPLSVIFGTKLNKKERNKSYSDLYFGHVTNK